MSTRSSAGSRATGSARRHLLSWVRDGLAGRIEGADAGSGAVPVRATLATEVTISTERADDRVAVAGPRMALHGPGDVTGIDPRQIVRTDPVAGTTAFEPDHLALVEFDDPALPWRLTPLAPGDGNKRLRPWLVLVVVDVAAPGVTLRGDPRIALPILDCPVALLPDLARSSAWAHAEVATAGDEDLAQVLEQRPERTVSRLIAPHRLAPGRSYLACVVPAFEHGRLAGLGEPLPAQAQTAPAWPGDSPVATLPVYHSWTFSTGAAGDFPALAQRLHAAVLDPGWLELAYGDADPELGEALGDDGALAAMLPALTLPRLEHHDSIPAAFLEAMERILDRGEQTVTPPLYLGAHTGHGPAWTGDEPPWMRELNLDPRLRGAAGLGAEVVRIHQEALMSSAWRQAAALEQVNRELQRGQLGRAVSSSLHRRHFTPSGGAARAGLDAAAAAEGDDVLVQRAATALRRIPGEDATVGAQLETHEPTASTASPDVQRAARPTGPAARAGGATTTEPLAPAVTAVATNELVPAPPVPAAADAGVLDRYTGGRTQYADIDAALVARAQPWWQNEAVIGRSLVQPGPVGYLTDLVVLQETDPAGGAPAANASLVRSIDFDGRPASAGAPRPVAADAAAPAVRTVGGAMTRRPSAPIARALLCGLRQTPGPWQPAVRWCTFDPDGTPAPQPWVMLQGHPGTATGADLILRRRAGQPDDGAEIVLCWAGFLPPDQGGYLAYRVCSYAPASGQPLPGTARRLPFTHFVGQCDLAFDAIPISVPAGQPYAEPRDVVLALAVPTFFWLPPTGPGDIGSTQTTWSVDYFVGRDFGTPQEAWSDMRRAYFGWRATTDEDSARVSISVTDLDGDGSPELVVHLTYDEALPGGGTRRVTRQQVGHGLRPSGDVAYWDSAPEIAVTQLAGARNTVCLMGDVDPGRAARLRALGDNFQALAERHQGMLIRPATRGAEAQPADYAVGDVAMQVSAATDPAATIPAAVADRVSLDGEALPQAPAGLARGANADPLRDRLYEPSFPQAMAEPLRELHPELVFPGADSLPDDSVALLGGNSELIAAYLAGANHELGRELLWRGFPSSGRATWFRSFFDARSADPAAVSGDIREISDWGGDLAGNTTGAASDGSVILLVRGELLRRYPNCVVLAARAVVRDGRREPADELLTPAFSGRAGAGVSLFSFAIGEDEVGSDPGWFFIFAEPPTEPRFAAASEPDWSGPGAHAAAALLRLPFRVAFHASDLLTVRPEDAR